MFGSCVSCTGIGMMCVADTVWMVRLTKSEEMMTSASIVMLSSASEAVSWANLGSSWNGLVKARPMDLGFIACLGRIS